MKFEEFVDLNRNKLAGYFLIERFAQDSILETPYPGDLLTEEEYEQLQEQLLECMPYNAFITGVRDSGIFFEDYLDADFLIESAFGDQTTLDGCAQVMADFVIGKSEECGIDYNQSPDDPVFDLLIFEESKKWIEEWRKAVLDFVSTLEIQTGFIE